MKKKGKSWFTLVELLIVILIIGLLMLMGLGLNWSNLKTLKSNTLVEEVKSSFDAFFLQVINSSSHLGQAYESAQIVLVKWENQPIISSFKFVSDENQNNDKKEEKNLISSDFFSQVGGFEIKKLLLNNVEQESVSLLYKPYDLKCQMRIGQANWASESRASEVNPSQDQLFISLLPKGGKEVCIQFSSNYCKMQSVSCETVWEKSL